RRSRARGGARERRGDRRVSERGARAAEPTRTPAACARRRQAHDAGVADHGPKLRAIRERRRAVRRGPRLPQEAREGRMSYRIEDEPGSSALERAIVDPRWPLLASMFAGGWLAFPWFVVNAFALGGK